MGIWVSDRPEVLKLRVLRREQPAHVARTAEEPIEARVAGDKSFVKVDDSSEEVFEERLAYQQGGLVSAFDIRVAIGTPSCACCALRTPASRSDPTGVQRSPT